MVLDATDHNAFAPVQVAMVGFVVPLTVITLVVVVVVVVGFRSWRRAPSVAAPA